MWHKPILLLVLTASSASQHKGEMFHPDPDIFKLAEWSLSGEPSDRRFSKASAKVISITMQTSIQIVYKNNFEQFACWCSRKEMDLFWAT